ncbi:hypothetical protein MUN77_08475 [Leucobacter allii]|uniref:hypothetical protein n=1 Tax=Leucobacter allii TaxID=2932247 RepID=UPI001FD34B72|nr:hypothetical protein [Leucobacter allii]UOR03300.1 hypothetical protein MUN77_08475 [Leucobacter allii]
MTPSEARLLASERRGLFGAGEFARLGDPGLRTRRWCRAAIALLVEEECWAPEIHWAPAESVRLRFRRRGNAEWAERVARRGGFAVTLEARGRRGAVLVVRMAPP